MMVINTLTISYREQFVYISVRFIGDNVYVDSGFFSIQSSIDLAFLKVTNKPIVDRIKVSKSLTTFYLAGVRKGLYSYL